MSSASDSSPVLIRNLPLAQVPDKLCSSPHVINNGAITAVTHPNISTRSEVMTAGRAGYGYFIAFGHNWQIEA